MDLTILIGVATALLVVLLTLLFLQKKKKTETDGDKPPAQQRRAGVPQPAQEGVPRRAQIARNQRNRLRPNAPVGGQIAPAAAAERDPQAEGSDEDGDGSEIPQGQVLDAKMGAKKRAKLEAKEQKRLQREQELRHREERQVRESKAEEERKRNEDHEAEEERRKTEAERLAREALERKEHEEYMKMKAAFSVEEEGYEEPDDEQRDSLLQEFIEYIKSSKVVELEDLAQQFNLKTQQAIDRLQELTACGRLTGVIDDRGKFIYISEDELQAVAKFIRQRGRVSIAELAESSNKLVNMTTAAAAAQGTAAGAGD